MALDKGRKNNQLLIQPQYSPMPVGEQVAILYCGTHGLMRTIRLNQVRTFQDLFLDRMRSLHAKDVLEPLAAGMLSPEITRIIEKEAEAVALSLRSTPERA